MEYYNNVVWTIALIFLGAMVKEGLSLDTFNCRVPLGMQVRNGEPPQIPDSALTASSSHNVASVGPANGRLQWEGNGGAWCPKWPINATHKEYLQIDLGKLTVITYVETQGRFGKGKGREFVREYTLEYQREEGGPWMRFKNRRSQSIFKGNDNTYIPEMRAVTPPIITRKIRFVPYSKVNVIVCLRVEVYGCTWDDGLVSYTMPQGEQRGSDVFLRDYTYDQPEGDDGMLRNGLGQLTDGEEGNNNFRLDPTNLGKKGYEWVGWRNDSHSRKPIEIVFKFDAVREFQEVQIHCNNAFKRDVRVFRGAKFYFSVGGRYYQKVPVEYFYMRDDVMEFARTVVIKLEKKVGRYVKMILTFEARWIMISEVQFNSVVIKSNYTEEIPPTTEMPPGGPGHDMKSTKSSATDEPLENVNAGNSPHNPDQEPSGGGMDQSTMGIIIGAVSGVLVLVLVIGLFLYCRHRRSRGAKGSYAYSTRDQILMNMTDYKTNQNGHGKCLNGKMYNCVNMTSEMTHELDNRTNEIYHEPADSIQGRKLPDVPAPGDFSDREYAVPDVTKSASGVTMSAPPSSHYRHVIPSLLPTYPTADLANAPNIQGVSGNNVYSTPNLELLFRDDARVVEFPRENLNFIEKLGEGQFGEVHLCEAESIQDYLGDDFSINRSLAANSMLVAVKVLRKDANDNARTDFQKEVRLMSRLRDPNIVRVLAVCTQNTPACMIVEYMKYGDLNQFLVQHSPENTINKHSNIRTLSYGCLIFMASQIASGMKYLETMNMVHRDLATRNCLVGHLYTIKISDFGMSRSLYSSDYYRIEGRAVLPIRWMAWESILLGKFSSHSDVWSFAVTLWEILNFAREQPFDQMTDEQVIENCGHFYRNDGQQAYLSMPELCPKEIYDLMRECWNQNAGERPSFKEIHMFLQRKNMGYNPKDEKLMMNRLPVC